MSFTLDDEVKGLKRERRTSHTDGEDEHVPLSSKSPEATPEPSSDDAEKEQTQDGRSDLRDVPSQETLGGSIGLRKRKRVSLAR